MATPEMTGPVPPPWGYTSTMCVCGDNQRITQPGTDNFFDWHLNQRTGEACKGIPQEPDQCHADLHARLMVEVDHHVKAERRAQRYEGIAYRHSMFAYPHFWGWHALFDGTRLCRCWRSQGMKEDRRSVWGRAK